MCLSTQRAGDSSHSWAPDTSDTTGLLYCAMAREQPQLLHPWWLQPVVAHQCHCDGGHSLTCIFHASALAKRVLILINFRRATGRAALFVVILLLTWLSPFAGWIGRHVPDPHVSHPSSHAALVAATLRATSVARRGDAHHPADDGVEFSDPVNWHSSFLSRLACRLSADQFPHLLRCVMRSDDTSWISVCAGTMILLLSARLQTPSRLLFWNVSMCIVNAYCDPDI